MVAKEKKVALTKRSQKLDNKIANSILFKLENESEDDSSVVASLKAHLEPICKIVSTPGKENITDAQKHSMAKEFVPFLAQVLKLCSDALSRLHVLAEDSLQMKSERFFEAMKVALDCFEHLRDSLVGAPLEIEMQRSWLVRRLIACGKFQEALDQGLQLFSTLFSRAFLPKKTETGKQECSNFNEENFYLPDPGSAQELNQGLIVLTVGAATDLIVCATELVVIRPVLFELICNTAQRLEQWLSILDAEKAQKQRSLLFKDLNKCLMIRVSSCSEDLIFAEKLAFLALHQCALSSLNDNFCKVVRSICSRITSQGTSNTGLAIAVCEESLRKVGQIKQLQKSCGSIELVELVECYARLCQTAKRNQDGWNHILDAVSYQTTQEILPMMSLTGLYAVGLVLGADISEHLAYKACNILHGVIDTVQKILAAAEIQLSRSPQVKNQEIATPALTVRSFVGVYRALDFLRRSACSYTQQQWDIFIAGNGDTCVLSDLNGAVETCLLLFCKFVKYGLSCNCLSAEELDVFQRGSKSFFLAATAALRLSLLRQTDQKECIILMNDSITDTFPGQDELKWLMSSCYNMGVQLFNMKLHKMACDPFRVSYMAAWARVARIDKVCDWKLNQVADTENSLNFMNAMSDACAKSSVLVDSLNRSNETNEATKVFRESVEMWARSGVTSLRKSFPHSLLQPWLKRVFSMKLAQENDFDNSTICSIVQNFDPSLPQEAAGQLLEEELLFYETVEESEPVFALEMQRKLLELLLDGIYTAECFPIHRAKILVWKGRIKRIATVGDNEWLSYLTEAINILVNCVDNERKGQDTRYGAIESHLAQYYFLRAICLQETDPSSKDPMDDIYNGLNLLEALVASSYNVPVDQHQIDIEFQTIALLKNLSDMLALKGYYKLQYRIYSLLLDIVPSFHLNSEDAFVAVFSSSKLNHIFCNSPFLRTLPDLVRQKLELNLNSKDLLESLVKKHPKGIFPLAFLDILKVFSRTRGSMISDDSLQSSWEEIIQEAQEPKANETICNVAHAYFMIADLKCRNASLQEALRNANEALSLRLKLLYRFFKISSKPSRFGVAESEPLDDNQKRRYLEPLQCVAVSKWPRAKLGKHDASPSQWHILSNYLESLMQVGTLNQMLGIIDDAENSFQEGFQVAVSHGLSFAGAVFSSCLGEVHRKKHSWKIAEDCFSNAKQLINDQDTSLYCDHCRDMVEAVLSSRVADLEYRRDDRHISNPNETCDHVVGEYCSAEERLYRLISRYDKNKYNESMSNPSKTSSSLHSDYCNKPRNRDCVKPSCLNSSDTGNQIPSSSNRLRTGKRSTKMQKGGSELEPKILNEGNNSTHGYRTRRKVAITAKKIEDDGVDQLCMETNTKLAITESNVNEVVQHEIVLENLQKQRRSHLRKKKCDVDLDIDILNSDAIMHADNLGANSIKETNMENVYQTSDSFLEVCWCTDIKKATFQAKSIQEWLDNQMTRHVMHLMARVLLQKGKYFRNVQNIHKAHKEFYKALLLVRRGVYDAASRSASPGVCNLDCISLRGTELYPIEESSLLYHMSSLILIQEKCDVVRKECFFSNVDLSQALIWLGRAFILSREMPPLLSKVARTLAILHVPKDLGGPFEASLINNVLPLKSASYFHMVSLGATARQRHLTVMDARKQFRKLATSKDSEECCNAYQSIEMMEYALRIQPKDLTSLKSAIEHDLELPCSTICLSLVDQEMQSLFMSEKAIHDDAWFLITRYDTGSAPLTMMFHCSSLREGLGTSCCPYNLDGDDETVEEEKLSAFSSLQGKLRSILDESRQSTSGVECLNSVEDKCRWWEWRMDLDARLTSLLRMVESWLGPWKSFLLGNFSGKVSEAFKHSASCMKQQIVSSANCWPGNIELIRLLLQGAGELTKSELERGISWLLGQRKYHFCNNSVAGCRALLNCVGGSEVTDKTEAVAGIFLESFHSAMKSTSSLRGVPNPENVDLHRQPIILVLDHHLQAFPWESLPALRKNEIYRMPSVGIIQALVIHRSLHEATKRKVENLASKIVSDEHFRANTPIVPSIDPYNAYFLLNPSGDLGSTQSAFEEMFKTQHGWEGRVAEIPTAEEYMDGLQNHELFVYFGHGSGDQYLPERRMRKMKCCAAALLMGCSSGRLLPRGDYEPIGVPWSYLMAGCPTAIANLWDVTDGDIDRFSRVLLSNWLNSEDEQETRINTCAKGKESKSHRRGHRAADKSEEATCRQNSGLQGRVSTATHVGEGRDTCRLPYLIGASPVCYGIPTLIRRRRNPS